MSAPVVSAGSGDSAAPSRRRPSSPPAPIRANGTVLHCLPRTSDKAIRVDVPSLSHAAQQLGVPGVRTRYLDQKPTPEILVVLRRVHISKITFYPKYMAICYRARPVPLELYGVDYH